LNINIAKLYLYPADIQVFILRDIQNSLKFYPNIYYGILKDPEVVGNQSFANQHSAMHELICYSATFKRLNISVLYPVL